MKLRMQWSFFECYSDERFDMQNMVKQYVLLITLVAGAGIVAGVFSRCVRAQPSKKTNKVEPEKKEPKIMKVSAESATGKRRLKLRAPRKEALSVILTALESISPDYKPDSPSVGRVAFHLQLLRTLQRNYVGTRYEDKILGFLAESFDKKRSPEYKLTVLFALLQMDPKGKHEGTKRAFEKARQHQGETKIDKMVREGSQGMLEYRRTGDEKGLEKWPFGPRTLMTKKELKQYRKEHGIKKMRPVPDFEKMEGKKTSDAANHFKNGLKIARLSCEGDKFYEHVGLSGRENATWVFFGDGEKLAVINGETVKFNFDDYGDFTRGEFEVWVRNYSAVKRISWRGAVLRGKIPPALGKFENLKHLDLSVNELSGKIPGELGNLQNLRLLSLFDNRLTGTIPTDLANLQNLKCVRLSGNRLAGEIPEELGKLTHLQVLSLRGNKLSGNIPPELGQLANLKKLDLSHNKLTGEIPPELANLKNLEELYLEGNELTGEVPENLQKALKSPR